MKHLENHELEWEGLKRELDLDAVPRVVEDRLRQVCAELPEELPTKRHPLWAAGKAAAWASAGLCAAFLLLFGVNAVNPALAESLPGVGSLFAVMNDSMRPMGSHVGTFAGGAKELDLKASASAGSDYGLTVEEGFCDGKFLYLTLRLTCPEDAEKYESVGLNCEGESDFEFRINGEKAELAGGGADQRKRDGALALACVLKLPEEAENGEPLDISLRVGKLYGVYPNYESDRRFDVIETGFSAEFSVAADTTKNSAQKLEAEDNGVKLYGAERTPGYLLVDLEIPFWGREQDDRLGGGPIVGYAMLFTEDGRELRHNSGLADYDFVNEEEAERIRGTWAFDGPPEQSGKVVLRVLEHFYYSDGEEEKPLLFAEFTIDWKSGTAVPSETYREEGFQKADTEEYRNTPRHPDFTGGYLVADGGTREDMWHGSDRPVSYAMLYSDTEYRPIELRFYRGGELMGTVAAHPEEEFNDEDFNEGAWPAYRDETGYYTAMPAEENTKGAAKYLLMFACYYPPDQKLDEYGGVPSEELVDRVDLVDSATGEVLIDLAQAEVYKP